MPGSAFSSATLGEASTGGLPGLGEHQDYSGTLQASSKHVPVLCTGATVNHSLEFITMSPGPWFLTPHSLLFLSNLRLLLHLEAKARFTTGVAESLREPIIELKHAFASQCYFVSL